MVGQQRTICHDRFLAPDMMSSLAETVMRQPHLLSISCLLSRLFRRKLEIGIGGSGTARCSMTELEEQLTCERRQSHEQMQQMQSALEEQRVQVAGLTPSRTGALDQALAEERAQRALSRNSWMRYRDRLIGSTSWNCVGRSSSSNGGTRTASFGQ